MINKAAIIKETKLGKELERLPRTKRNSCLIFFFFLNDLNYKGIEINSGKINRLMTRTKSVNK